MKKRFTVAQLLLASMLGVYTSAHAQLGIGTTSPNNSAVLEMSSTKQGFLPPRMTTQQRDAINKGSFAEGLMIYNTDEKCIQVWDGEVWGCTSGGSSGGGGVTNMAACAGLKDVKSVDNKYGETAFFLGGDNKLYSAEGRIPSVKFQYGSGSLNETDMIVSVPSANLNNITWKKIATRVRQDGLGSYLVFLLSDSGRLYALEHPGKPNTSKLSTLHILRSTPHSSKERTLINELTPFEITAKDANNKSIVWEEIIVEGNTAYAYGNGNWYAWGTNISSKILGNTSLSWVTKSSPTLVSMFNTFDGNKDYISFTQHLNSVAWIDKNQEVNFYKLNELQAAYKVNMPSGAKKPIKVVTTRNHDSGMITQIYVLDSSGKVYEYAVDDTSKTFKKMPVGGGVVYTDIHIGGTRYGRPHGVRLLDNKGNLYEYPGIGSNTFYNLTKNSTLPKLDKIFGFYVAYDNGADHATDELIVRSNNGHLISLSFGEPPVNFMVQKGARGLILDDDMMFKVNQSEIQGRPFSWYTLWHCVDTDTL